ncbi:MAG: asparagine synthase (glutamine-hydrolyzing) [Sedimentisphaerales bacterium]|nr:asparagine synthase (glutamine-hydrolyzing) [Sedimentisphaerales bacterium]
MCGICALFHADPIEAEEPIKKMVAVLRHRGPDAKGIKIFSKGGLGHTRLSVIDLESGDQPMGDQTRRYWIIFNGEIYNYREIRDELISLGYAFGTQSDTEVILLAYVQWGRFCLDRFRGMFAFVIWDTLEGTLFAARDLFGEKPLYFAVDQKGVLLVTSEIKALIASGRLVPRLDYDAVDAYLALGYVPPDRTIYTNIHTLPPGHYLLWDGQKPNINRYWKPHFLTKQRNMDDAAEELDELLKRAIKRQMVADVPIGAFLSGGLDSSTVVALMSSYIGSSVKTFSVGFGDYINELPYARTVAQQYSTDHFDVDLGEPDVGRTLERMTEVYDEPFADTSNIPTYLISRFAGEHVKVVLSGDGADELFGGYAWYLPLIRSEAMKSSVLKWMVCRSVSRLLGHRFNELNLNSMAMGLSARWPDMWTRNVMCNMQIRPVERRSFWGDRWKNITPYSPGEYFQPAPETKGMDRAFHYDLSSYLPGDILVKVDRAAMAHGLETRAPFLDRDLVEFVFSLPASLKVRSDQTKVLFRHVCRQYWPEALRMRAKQGFGSPIDRWLKRPDVKNLIRENVEEGTRLRALLPGIKSLPCKNLYAVWILLVLGLWLEKNQVTI